MTIHIHNTRIIILQPFISLHSIKNGISRRGDEQLSQIYSQRVKRHNKKLLALHKFIEWQKSETKKLENFISFVPY